MHELAGLERMRVLKHPNLITMITYYDYGDIRAFLMPIYQSDLEDYLMGDMTMAEDPDTLHRDSEQNSYHDSEQNSYHGSEQNSYHSSEQHSHHNSRPNSYYDPLGRNFQHRDTLKLLPTNNWLWRGIVGVLKGLQKFHEYGKVRAAHLDLKPKNILISHNGDLVIADCGLSRVVAAGESLTVMGYAGTEGYSPPVPHTDPDTLPLLNEKYDTWSMACIMMEVMLFLLYGTDSVKCFRSKRTYISGGRNSDSFWEPLPGGRDAFRLKPVVEKKLQEVQDLSIHAGDNSLTKLTILLRKMFSISPDERGTIGDCLNQLRNEHPIPSLVLPHHGDNNTERGRIIDSLHINVDLAMKEHELGFYGNANRPRTLQPISEL